MNPPASLPELADRRAALADCEAFVFSDERVTLRGLVARSVVLARCLLGAGVRRGDRIGLLQAASIDGYALLLGAMRLGAIPVPVNLRYKAGELEYVVRRSGMRLLVAEPSFAELVGQAVVGHDCRVVFGVTEPEFAGGAEPVEPERVARAQAAVGADDDALMLFTSGTTANPKACVHRQFALPAQAERLAERLGLTPADRVWMPLPFFHIAGICGAAATIAAGCTNVQMRYFEPSAGLDLLERERCTVADPSFETIWRAILNHPRFPEADLSPLRLVINIGVPNSLRQMQERLPHVPQVSCFGGTEFGGFVSLASADEPLEARIEMGGKLLRDMEVRVIDPDTGKDVEVGRSGELLMRGPCRFMRYYEDPEATAEAIDADGWYHSGDLGKMDAEGRVAFVGRLKDMLKVGGENVAAAEIETFLLTHPAVEIVQVVAAPDARYVEVPAAFVQLRPGATAGEQELIDHCRGRIATFKVPRYVRFVDEWPMSGTKIQKYRLRERITAELTQAGISEAPKIASA